MSTVLRKYLHWFEATNPSESRHLENTLYYSELIHKRRVAMSLADASIFISGLPFLILDEGSRIIRLDYFQRTMNRTRRKVITM